MGRFMEDVTTRRRIFLSLSKLGCGLKEFNSRKFHLAWVESSCPTFCGKVFFWRGRWLLSLHSAPPFPPPPLPQTIPQSLGQLLSTQAITHFQSGLFILIVTFSLPSPSSFLKLPYYISTPPSATSSQQSAGYQ